MIKAQDAIKFLNILELNPNNRYTLKDFKKAWRELCKRYHPDKHSEAAYEQYQKDKEACEKEGGRYTGEVVLSPTEAEAKFKEVTHAFRMLTDKKYAMEATLGNSHPAVNLDVQIPYSISFDQAFFGTTIALSVAINEYDENGKILTGEGGKPVPVIKVEAEVPPGTTEPTPIKLKGKGCICNGKHGDAIVLVHPQPSDKFRVDPETGNVHHPFKAPLHIMLRGGVCEVMTMYGTKSIKVPAGTQPNDTIRIPKCGVEEQGYQIVEFVQPDIPKRDEIKNNDEWVNFKPDFDIGIEEEEMKQDDEFMRIAQRIYFDSNGRTSSVF